MVNINGNGGYVNYGWGKKGPMVPLPTATATATPGVAPTPTSAATTTGGQYYSEEVIRMKMAELNCDYDTALRRLEQDAQMYTASSNPTGSNNAPGSGNVDPATQQKVLDLRALGVYIDVIEILETAYKQFPYDSDKFDKAINYLGEQQVQSTDNFTSDKIFSTMVENKCNREEAIRILENAIRILEEGDNTNKPKNYPTGGYYTVKQGDNLWKIARKLLSENGYKTDNATINEFVAHIAKESRLSDPGVIYPKQTLKY